NSYFEGDTNHYIVLSGLSGDNLIYNDAAYFRGVGRGLMISPEVLSRAWANSVIPGHAVAFALDAEGSGVLGRNIVPVFEGMNADDVEGEIDDDGDAGEGSQMAEVSFISSSP